MSICQCDATLCFLAILAPYRVQKMDITRNILLELGFIEVIGRSTRYSYKGFTGRLNAQTGQFYFHGFNPGINQVSDLRYMMLLIDHNYESSFVGYPANLN